jgi:hypothetical protein
MFSIINIFFVPKIELTVNIILNTIFLRPKMLDVLPNEIIVDVFEYLDLNSHLNLIMISKRYYNISRCHQLHHKYLYIVLDKSINYVIDCINVLARTHLDKICTKLLECDKFKSFRNRAIYIYGTKNTELCKRLMVQNVSNTMFVGVNHKYVLDEFVKIMQNDASISRSNRGFLYTIGMLHVEFASQIFTMIKSLLMTDYASTIEIFDNIIYLSLRPSSARKGLYTLCVDAIKNKKVQYTFNNIYYTAKFKLCNEYKFNFGA